MKEDFEKDDFQKRVAEEFDRNRSINTAENFPLEKLERGLRGSAFGCLLIPMLTLFHPKRLLRKEREKRNYASFETKTNLLLNERGIREAIREAFEELPKDEIVTEDTFVRVFTETLSRDDLRQQFDIPLKPILFAMVGYGIFKVGIREFCSGHPDEE